MGLKLLLVGDPHVTVDELADSEALIDLISQTATATRLDGIVLLGDLFHNHAVLRVEVLQFWKKALTRLASHAPVYALVGNHDRPNDASTTAHALQTLNNDNIVIVDIPTWIGSEILLLPYFHDKDEFALTVRQYAPKTLICHQTFAGSQYDNGFYAPDGVEAADIGVPVVISGHIHTEQVLTWSGGYVHYVGSPRWRTLSDANVNKNIVIAEFGSEVRMTAIDTSGACRPIGRGVVRTLDDVDGFVFAKHPKAINHVDLIGPKDALDGLASEVRKRVTNCKFRFLPTGTAAATSVRESEGIGQALKRFVRSAAPPYGTPIDHLTKMVAERLHV